MLLLKPLIRPLKYLMTLARLLFFVGLLAGMLTLTAASPIESRPAVITVTPTLGNYPNTSLSLSTDTMVLPDAAPANATSISVSTSTNFKGKLEGYPGTGVVRVTDAHPAGTYAVTVRAFDSAGGRQRFMAPVRAQGAEGPHAAAERQEHPRDCVGQGRRRQEHDRGQSRAGAAGRGRARGFARRRHLRTEHPAHDGRFGQARFEGWPASGAEGRAWHPDDVDRLHDRRGHADDLAWPDGHPGVDAVAQRDELGRS